MFDRGKAGIGCEPCRGRHAGGLLRSRAGRRGAARARAATARRAGPALPRSCSRRAASMSSCGSEGTLVLALTADDQAEIGASSGVPEAARSAAGMAVGGGNARRASRILPARSPGAVFCPQDHQVDNRKLVAALRIAAETAGVDHSRASAGQGNLGSQAAVPTASSSKTARGSRPIVVVLAAGAWSRGIGGLAAGPAAAGAAGQRADAGACGWMPRRRSSIMCCGRPAPIWCRGATAG